ncbi:serine acetyltransferase [Methylobacterium sp. E-041]|uniref:serine O-acetyltransferase n=1 Tax=unclassified Methylobacterium TaxID=2615210 RepID=UPI001FB99A08|nr:MULTISPECIES: serine acetyltransferase [unclassified Methylobacterium]MCJ2077283.1 serine acetyltransferase [Methylobacterium sp. E-016]MCJ2107548.1 serine acetyltransferase [Methylobacterium sp. E-041]
MSDDRTPSESVLDHARPAVLRRLLAADLERIVRQISGGRPMSRSRAAMMVLLPAMQCAVFHRVAHLLHRRGWRRTAAAVAGLSVRLTGASFHPGSRIGPGLFVPHPARIAFCGTAGRDLVILPAVVVAPDRPVLAAAPFPPDAPHLGDGVVVGAHALVMGAVTIGDAAMVGVGVATLRDIPAGTVSMQRLRQTSVSTLGRDPGIVQDSAIAQDRSAA